MKNDRMKGRAKQIEGRAMRTIGKLTGSRKTQVKGAIREVEGIAQSARGRGEAALRRTQGRIRSRASKASTDRPRAVKVETTKTVVRTRRG